MSSSNKTQTPAKELTPEQKAAAEKAAKEKHDKELKANEEVKKIPVLKLTKDNYVPDPVVKEKGCFVARVEKKRFDAVTGERKSIPRVVVMNPKAWANYISRAYALGESVDLLYDPTGKYPEVGFDPEHKKYKAKLAEARKKREEIQANL